MFRKRLLLVFAAVLVLTFALALPALGLAKGAHTDLDAGAHGLVAESESTPTETPQPPQGCPADAVRLQPGDDLQNIIDSQPAGSTFCLAAGIYQNQTIQPRSGDSYIGQPGAIMDGGTTQRFAFKSILEPNAPNPIQNVTVRGLTIQNYASQTSVRVQVSPEGAIEGGEGWLIEDNIIQDNISGISLGNANWGWGDGAIVRNNKILHNAEIGVEINGSNIVFEGNELAGNGWDLNDEDRKWSGGGSKFTDQPVWADSQKVTTVTRPRTEDDHLVIRDNHIHDNVGNGLWLDVYNQYAIVEDNLIENNYGSGVQDELNTATIIRNNTLRDNRKGNQSTGLWGGGEILIVNSQQGEVTGNDISVSGTGRAVVMLYEAGRSDWPSQDYYVHHNTIRFQNTPEYRTDVHPVAGIMGGGGHDPFFASNNRYDFNTYYVSDCTQKFWFWGQGYTWADFKSQGQERFGRCYYGADQTLWIATGPAATATPTVVPTAIPAHAIPGRIEVEDFNVGTNGEAYFDTTPGHAEGAVYRTDMNDVDLKPSPYGGYAVGWFEAGEWMSYTLNVSQAGDYDILFFGGSKESDHTIHLEVDGEDVTGPISVPTKEDWGVYAEFSGPTIHLEAGEHTLRLVDDTGFLDVDWFEFHPAGESGSAAPPAATATATH